MVFFIAEDFNYQPLFLAGTLHQLCIPGKLHQDAFFPFHFSFFSFVFLFPDSTVNHFNLWVGLVSLVLVEFHLFYHGWIGPFCLQRIELLHFWQVWDSHICPLLLCLSVARPLECFTQALGWPNPAHRTKGKPDVETFNTRFWSRCFTQAILGGLCIQKLSSSCAEQWGQQVPSSPVFIALQETACAGQNTSASLPRVMPR